MSLKEMDGMDFEIILRKVASLQMNEIDKQKYGIKGRGALEGYADADWWRALDMDKNFLEDDTLKKALSDIKRILTGIMKAIDILQSEINALKSR